VNYGQSTNDVIPTSIRIMILINSHHFVPVLEGLRDAFLKKGKESTKLLNRAHAPAGRVPVRLGQNSAPTATFSKRTSVRYKRAWKTSKSSHRRTAVGTVLNAIRNTGTWWQTSSAKL